MIVRALTPKTFQKNDGIGGKEEEEHNNVLPVTFQVAEQQ